MTIQAWSGDITVAELTDDPMFTDELGTLVEMLSARPANVVLNLRSVGYLNSSNIARLLRLRKQMINSGRRLILCAASNQVWGVFMVTGLDKIFEFTNDVATALATMQLTLERKGGSCV